MKLKSIILGSLLVTTGTIANAQWNLNGNSIISTNFIGSTNNLDFIMKTNNTERMRITNAGNVGIGLTAPTAKLHVHQGILKLSDYNSFGGPMVIWGGTSTTDDWGLEYVPSGNKGLNFWKPFGSTNAGNFYLFLADATANIGIRTDNPTANLTVNGNTLIGDPASVTLPSGYRLYVQDGILTEKLKIALKSSGNWSDYVFASEYKLKPLKEVEAFIHNNKHLPNIPSAEQMVSTGLDVAAMDAKLLEKIEELTLYLIDQSKKIEQLESKNTELNDKLIKLSEK